MVLPEKLLDKLVCPKCKGKLEYDEKAGRLQCRHDRLAYRIENNVPVLLIDEAEPFDEGASDAS